MLRRTVFLAALALFWATAAPLCAAELRVVSSAGFKPAYLALLADFERQSGHKVVNSWGPSLGATAEAVPNRLARGETFDVILGAKEALVALGSKGLLDAGSVTDLANSLIGAVVRSGAPKPDISSVPAFKTALLNARSIAYSDSASGIYIREVLYPRLGLGDDVKAKSRTIAGPPKGEQVAEVVARGEAELGFQQMSELIPVKGVDIVGLLPAEIQKVTVFSAALGVSPKEKEAAIALIKFLSAPAAGKVIRDSGMEPIAK